jgi:esterase/lipase superfamily enzyme
MKRYYRKWHSSSLGKAMEILIFGDHGIPVIVFPTGKGRFYEWENRRMTETVRDKVDAGYNQLFCIDSIINESLLNKNVDAFTRVIRLQQYENYIIDEVFPVIEEMNGNCYKILAGCEFGAYLSLLYLLKHPKKIQKSIAISGIYDIKPFLNGFYDDNVYFNNPVDFIPNLFDSEILQMIESNEIKLISYEGDENEKSTRRMSNTFKMRHINHGLEIWQNCDDERWSNWRKMFRENIV